MSDQKPNIIYINSHDTGRYIQPYGHRVGTPHLQQLAEEGVLFRQSFSAAPTCSPSRAALCTGMYPHCCGMVGLGNRGIYPFDYNKHLAHTLKQNGYQTLGCGNHMGAGNSGDDPTVLGYDEVLSWDGQQDAIAFIEKKHDKPFFLSLSYGLTHRKGRGFGVEPDPEKNDPRYVVPPATLADTPEIRADWAHFLTTATALDDKMGEIIAAVDKAGLRDNTIIIATTDHGVAFPGMKCNLTVHGVGIFLVMRGPGGFTGGKTVDAMVSHVDLFPTLCDLAGIDKPAWLQGRSLAPLVNGQAVQVHDEIFSEVSYHAAFEPMRSLRSQRWVYIRRFGPRRRPVMVNCDESPTKDAWKAHGYAERRLPDEMLFDTFYDPQEMNNLALDPDHQHILVEMRERLRAWMEKTDDPLCQGEVPMPTTGWENFRDAQSPDSTRRE